MRFCRSSERFQLGSRKLRQRLLGFFIQINRAMRIAELVVLIFRLFKLLLEFRQLLVQEGK